jgi:hypothetical protein
MTATIRPPEIKQPETTDMVYHPDAPEPEGRVIVRMRFTKNGIEYERPEQTE